MYLFHYYVSIFSFKLRTTRQELASEFRPKMDRPILVGFFIRGTPIGFQGCSSDPKAESTVDPKELGWQAAI